MALLVASSHDSHGDIIPLGKLLVKQGSASTQSPASVQKDLGQIATNGHAFLVAEQQKIAQAPALGGRMLPPQRHEARRDLADGGVRRRARQDAAFSLARQKQQQEHADGLGLARAWRAPDEAELARRAAETQLVRNKIRCSRAANSLICSPAQILATWAFPNLQAPTEPPAHSCRSQPVKPTKQRKIEPTSLFRAGRPASFFRAGRRKPLWRPLRGTPPRLRLGLTCVLLLAVLVGCFDPVPTVPPPPSRPDPWLRRPRLSGRYAGDDEAAAILLSCSEIFDSLSVFL
jgi:hypothetical protein